MPILLPLYPLSPRGSVVMETVVDGVAVVVGVVGVVGVAVVVGVVATGDGGVVRR